MNTAATHAYLLGKNLPAGLAGPKAARLHALAQAGFRLPQALIIPYETVEKIAAAAGLQAGDAEDSLSDKLAQTPAFRQAAAEWLAALQPFGSLLLRSAASVEDGQQQTMPGLFASQKGIHSPQQLGSAFAHCWRSARQLMDKLPQPGRLSFLLQHYIEADYAGVCFTVDPMKPVEHELCIEWTVGGAERLTSGQAVDGRLRYDWRTRQYKELSSQQPADALLHELAHNCLAVQQWFGCPQDIEWAIAGSDIYLLQARPVSRLYFESDDIWTNANFRDGGIGARLPTPLMWSLYSLTFEYSLTRFVNTYHLQPRPMPRAWSTTFFGYPYWNLSATKAGSSRVLGYVERQFDEGQGIIPYYQGDGHRTTFSLGRLFSSLRTLLAIRRSLRGRFAACERARADFFEKMLPQFEAFPLREASLRELVDYFEEMSERQLLRLYASYWEIIYDNTFLSTFTQNALQGRPGRPSFAALTAAIEDIAHLRPLLAMWTLAQEIGRDAAASDFWLGQSPDHLCELYLRGQDFPHKTSLQALLEQYGYKSAHELELSVPNWSEDPRMPVETIQSFLRQPALDLPAQLAQQYRQQAALLAGIESRRLRRQLAQQRRLIWWKEELRDVSTHFYHLLRQLCLQLGRRLQEAGRIDSPLDVFYLDYKTLLALGRGGIEARELIAYHKAREASFRHFDKPDLIFPSTWASQGEAVAAEGGLRDIGVSPSLVQAGLSDFVAAGRGLRGIGVSPGSAVGKAWVIPALEQGQLENIPAGSILVTAYLNPAHIAFFAGLRAVVTANGGLLSHGAIMCRELGVPAVFGVTGLLEKVRSGDEIELDGQAGWIALRGQGAGDRSDNAGTHTW